MKAMVLTGIRQMEMRQVAEPVIKQDSDVLIKVRAVGVCGSDIHYYTTGRIGDQVVKYPFTVGHEFAGEVAAVGKAVKRLKPGDRVAVDPAMPCGKCDQCRIGRVHTCRNIRFLGCPGQAEGCLSEYVVMPQECCFIMPDDMTMVQGAISEPLSIGVYAVKQAEKLSGKLAGLTVGILGAGPIGLSVLMPAVNAGAGKVYMTDKIDDRLAVALRAGASWVGNPDKQDIAADIARAEPLLLDVVFECCGQQEAVNQAIDILKPGGKLMIIGIPEQDRLSFDVSTMRHKEICIQNVRRQVGCVQAALDLITRGSVDVANMVTHNFDFNETPAAFDLVAEYGDGVVKAMINF